MKPTTVIDNIPSTGTDCKISTSGIKNFSACLFLAANGATVKVNINEKNLRVMKKKEFYASYNIICKTRELLLAKIEKEDFIENLS